MATVDSLDRVAFFVLGASICVGILALVFAFTDNNCSIAADALEQCELQLPRNQHCVITAVPAESQE